MPLVNPTPSSKYYARAVVADGGKSDIKEVVTIYQKPEVSLGNDQTVCQGASVFLQTQNLNGFTPGKYHYFAPNASLEENGSASYTVTASVTDTYSVEVTSGNNVGKCKDTASVKVTVTPAIPGSAIHIMPNPGTNEEICAGESLTLTASVDGSYTGTITYEWGETVDAADRAKETITVTPKTQTTYTLNVKLNGCPASGGGDSKIVKVNALPIPTINNPAAVCGGTVDITQSGSGYHYYSDQGLNTSVANPAAVAAGEYWITYTDAKNCTSEAKKVTATVNTPPTPKILVNGAVPTGDALCVGTEVTLSCDNTYAQYTWTGGTTTQSWKANIATGSNTFGLSVRDANNCTGTATQVVITGKAAPSVTINPVNAACAGDDINLTAVPAWVGGTAGTIVWNGNVANASAATTTATLAGGKNTYTVTVTDPNECTATASVEVTGNQLTLSSMTVDPSTLKAGDPVALSIVASWNGESLGDSNADYVWKKIVSGTETDLATTRATNDTPDANTTYKVIVTKEGCEATAEGNVTVQTDPFNVSEIAGYRAVCDGEDLSTNPVKLYVTASGGQKNYEYQWTVPAGITVDGGTTTDTLKITGIAYSTILAGSSVGISVAVNDHSTPANTANKTIPFEVRELPKITISDKNDGESLNACKDVATTLTAAVTGVTSGVTYSWNTGATGASINATTATAGSSSYTVTATYVGCSADATVEVIVNELPELALTATAGGSEVTKVCPGTEITLTAVVTGESNPAVVWGKGANGLTGSTPVTNVNGLTTYEVKYTDAATTCTATKEVSVDVHGTVRLAIGVTPGTTVCAGSEVELEASKGVSYQWAADGTELAGETNAVLTVHPTTPVTYTVSGKDANGCVATPATASITITPAPTLAVSATTLDGCAGSTLNLETVVDRGHSTPSMALRVKDAGGNLLSGTTVSTDGVYTLYLDGGGDCPSNEKQVTVTFHALPNVSFQADVTEVCSGEAVVLTASSTDNPVPVFTYGGTNNTTWTVYPDNTGNDNITQTYTVKAKDNFKCEKEASVTVTVKPLPNVQITDPGKVCASNEVTLTATGADTYAWTGGLTAGSGATYSVTPTLTNKQFSVTGTKNGCENTKTITLDVEEAPVLDDAKDLAECLNGQVDLRTAYTVGYDLKFFDPDKNPLASSSVTVTGNATYYVKATAGNCSTDFKPIQVTAKPLPTVAILGNNEFCAGGETTLSTDGNGVDWTWSPAGKGGATTGSSLVVNPANTTSYTVTAKGGNNCTATASVEVVVNPLPELKWDAGNPSSLVAGSSAVWNVGFKKETTPNYVYTWKHNGTEDPAYPNDNYSLTGQTNPERLEVYVTDGNGCQSPAIDVEVPVTPQGGELSVALTSQSSSNEICQGGIQILTATPSGGRIPYTYTWYKDGVDMGLADNPASITVADAALYKVVVTDAGTPAQNAKQELRVDISATLTAPVVAVTDLTIPAGNSTVLWASVTPAAGDYSYRWSKVEDLKDASQETLPAPETKLLTKDTEYEVIVKAVNGCYNRASGWVRVDNSHGFKVLATVDPEKVCIGNTAQLNATLSGNLPADAEYEWIPATGLSNEHAANPVFTAGAAGIQEYIVKVTGDGLYVAVSKVSVNVENKAAPVLELTAQGDISCVGQAITVSAQGGQVSGGYQWSIDGRTPISGGTTLDTLVAGNRHVKVTATAQNGCAVAAVEMDYVLHDLPVLEWAPNTPAVVDKGSSVTVTVIADHGKPGNYTYNWTSPSGGTANRGEYTYGPMNFANTFTVKVTDDDTKCENTIDTMIKVQPKSPDVEITVKEENVNLCVNGIGLLEVTSVKGGNGVENDFATYTYSWTNASGTVVSTKKLYVASVAGTYTVKVTEPNTGKFATKEITVTNSSSLAPSVADATLTVQTGFQAYLFASVTGGTPEYSYCWTPEGSLSTSNTRVNPTTTALSAQQDFTCYVTDANGCSGEGTVRVDVVESSDPDLFTLTAKADNPNPCKGNAVQLSAIPSRTLTNPKYEWTPVTDLSDANIANPVFTANTPTTVIYTVKATEENGYSVTAQVKVTVKSIEAPRLELADNTGKCAGEKLTVENKNTAAPVANYHWVIDGVLDNSVIGSEYPLEAGSGQTVKVYADALNGCSSDTASGIFDRKPTPAIAWNEKPASAFEGDDFTVSVTSEAGVTYVWKYVYTPEGGTPEAEQAGPPMDEFEWIAVDKGTYAFTVYVEKDGCRSETLSHEVTVLEHGVGLSVITDVTYKQICENGSAVVTATALNASGDCTYKWYAGTSPGGTPVATGKTVILSPSSPDQRYVVEVNDGTGTAISSPVRLVFNDNMAPEIAGGTQYVAMGHATVLVSHIVSGTPKDYHWSSPNNLLASGEETKQNPRTAVLSDDETYTYYVTDNNGCISKPADVTVIVDKTADALAIEAGADMTALCRGNVAHLNVVAIQGTLSEAATYTWTPSAYLTGANTAHPVFETVVPGSYTYFVKVSDGGKDYYASVDLNVKPYDAPEFDWDQVPASYAVGSCCEVTTKVTKETATPYKYHWLEPEVSLNDSKSSFAVPTTTEPRYQFVVYMTDANDCQSKDTLKAEVAAEASTDQIEIAVENVAACVGSTATLRVTKTAGPDDVIYEWTSTGISSIENANTAEATAQLAGIDPGIYSVKVTVTAQNDNTNKAEGTVTLTVAPLPTVEIDQTCLALHKDSTVVLNIANVRDYEYLWQESKHDGVQDLWQTPENKGTGPQETVTMNEQKLRYILTGTTTTGVRCSASDTAIIYRIPDAPVLAIDTNTTHLNVKLKWGAVGGYDDYTVWSRKWDPYVITGGSYEEESTLSDHEWAEGTMDTLEFYYVTANKNACGQVYHSLTSDTVGYYLFDVQKRTSGSSFNHMSVYFEMKGADGGDYRAKDMFDIYKGDFSYIKQWNFTTQIWDAARLAGNRVLGDFSLKPGMVVQLDPKRATRVLQYGVLSDRLKAELTNANVGKANLYHTFVWLHRLDLTDAAAFFAEYPDVLYVKQWNFTTQIWDAARKVGNKIMGNFNFVSLFPLEIQLKENVTNSIDWK